MARGTPDVRPKIRCSCGEALVWSARPFCWVCPKVVKTMIEGLLEPGREKFNSPETTALIAEGHITCLPHEMVADDVQPDPGAFVNRAGGKLSALNGKVEKPTHFEDGTRVIYDDRGVALPRHHQSYQTIATWQCNDCGYRTPSAPQMKAHCIREKHSGAETPSGKALTVVTKKMHNVTIKEWVET
jgi:hypothetical protein